MATGFVATIPIFKSGLWERNFTGDQIIEETPFVFRWIEGFPASESYASSALPYHSFTPASITVTFNFNLVVSIIDPAGAAAAGAINAADARPWLGGAFSASVTSSIGPIFSSSGDVEFTTDHGIGYSKVIPIGDGSPPVAAAFNGSGVFNCGPGTEDGYGNLWLPRPCPDDFAITVSVSMTPELGGGMKADGTASLLVSVGQDGCAQLPDEFW